jgi:hypothetical protein
MARIPFFFGLSFLAAGAMIAIAALPALPRSTQAVDGRVSDNAIVFEGAAMTQVSASDGFPVTPPPGPRGDQEGTRLANVSALAPDAAFSKGARIILGPATRSAIEGKAISVLVFARSLPNNPSPRMALGLVGAGPIAWQEGDVSPQFSAIRFTFPATATPPTEVAFWPSTQGKGLGIEIKSMTLAPQTLPAPSNPNEKPIAP